MLPIREYIFHQQVKTLYSQIPIIVAGVGAISIAMLLSLAPGYELSKLIIWTAYMWTLCAIRLITLSQYRKQDEEILNPKKWLHIFLFFSTLNGIGTGLLVFVFFDTTQTVYCILVLLTYISYIAAGITSNGSHMAALIAYSLPATLLVLVRLILEDDQAYSILAVIITLYYLAIIGFGRNTNKTFVNGIKWRHERNTVIEELRAQKETAENAVYAKSRFLASASHDLRQPLHALGLFNDALRSRLTDPKSLDIMDKISSSTLALNELLHGMLDISKLDANVIENNPSSIDVNKHLKPIYHEFSARAREKHLNLNLKVEPNLSIFVDEFLFERVIRNLVDNAVKYTDAGEVKISAKLIDDTSVEIKITDTGIGIPENEIKDVFLEFTQLNNPERDKQKGLGLGLSIVKRLCQIMNIDMEFNSIEGHGTEIILDFPVGKAPTKAVDSTPENDFDHPQKTVLVVEDDPNILDGMALLLESFGFKAIKAACANQAMSLAHARKPDLIIADLRLPGETDGLEIIGAVRSIHNTQIPAILVTGDTAPEQIRTTSDSDVLVLHKPVETSALKQMIEVALKQ
jgi:signal transduction histidine kinase/CheY-like chemotaxis protein